MTDASYSATGTLECNVCRIPLKSDAEVWDKHLRSSQHIMRAERLRVSSGKTTNQSVPLERERAPSQNVSKKRKVDDEEEDSRKRNKPGIEALGSSFDNISEESNIINPGTTEDSFQLSQEAPTESKTLDAKTVDEDEWAAFEREIARQPSPEVPSALTATANITAAPVTTEGVVSLNQEDVNVQGKERGDAETEAEKEDAARALEEEFDQMEDYEERVKQLREKREELRQRRLVEGKDSEGALVPEPLEGVGTGDTNLNEDEDESDGDFDDWDNWGRS